MSSPPQGPPYGQPGQQPGQPYGQPAQPGYGQPGHGGHPGQQYGQPGQQYGQPAQPPYGQPAQPPYGQPAAPPYGIPGQYGTPGPYGSHGQYGAPGPYGPGHGRPADRSRPGLLAGLAALVVVVIGAVLLFVLLGGSTVLDQGAVEQDVAAQFEEREGVAIDLTCPADMEVSSGASYECTGTTAANEEVTLEIAITDEDSAAYTWTEP
jgi:hypothetical protein